MDTQQRRLVSGNGRRITRGGCPRTMSRTRGSTVSRTTDGAHQIRTQKELLDLASSRSLQTWRRADSVNRGRKNLTRVGSRIEWNWKTASMDGLQGILEPIKFFISVNCLSRQREEGCRRQRKVWNTSYVPGTTYASSYLIFI